MEKFVIGVALGAVCGALLVANNYKMRALVKKGQDEVMDSFDKMIDEKLTELNQKADRVKEQVKTETEQFFDGDSQQKSRKKD